MTPVSALSILIGANHIRIFQQMTDNASPVQAPDEDCLRDSEVALMDAIMTILEIVVAKKILPRKCSMKRSQGNVHNIRPIPCRGHFLCSTNFVEL
jgi:hypothetical protein